MWAEEDEGSPPGHPRDGTVLERTRGPGGRQDARTVSDDTIVRLTTTLGRTCRRLAEAGEPRLAGLLAADGWSAVRHTHPRQAQRLNGVMHYIARLEDARPEGEETTMATDTELDVRTEIPRRRHELIFEEFGKLAPGSSYVLVNDHDPKPLYYQFEAEYAGSYSWEYLEQGPEVWRVRIGRVQPSQA